MPDGEFLRGAGAGGVEARDDRAEEVDAVGGIFQGGAEVLVAVDGVANYGPTERVGPEDGREEKCWKVANQLKAFIPEYVLKTI